MTKQSTAAGCMTNGDDAGPGKPGSPRLGAALAGERIGGLDFLRAIAVLLVLLDHSGVAAFGPIVLIDGGLGVEAFLVISGFLITHLLLKEVDQRGRISLLGFYRRRAARLLPAFYAYLLVGLVPLIMAGKYAPWDAVAASALYVINYYQALSGAPTHYLSHCWSLAVEEQFYLLWPLAFVWLLRRRWPLVRVLCIAIAVAWLLKLAYVFAFDVSDAYLYRSLETRGDELAIGCLLAVLLRSESWQRRFEPLAALRWKAIALLAVLLVASITVLRGSVPVKYLVGYSIEPLLVALLLPLVVLESGHRDGLARWFNARPMVLIGQVSYGVYLFHPLVLHSVQSRVERVTGSAGAGLVVSIGVTIALAYASFRWFEQPLRQRIAGASANPAARLGRVAT